MGATPRQEKLAILFADISGSTALYDKLGNVEALHLVTLSLDIMIAEVAPHKGTLIKTIGDEIMCTFPTAADALDAARAMQLAMERERPGKNQSLYIRIGFHYGEVIHDGNDAFGDAVNVAARVASITRARQILTTQAAVDTLPDDLRNKIRHVARAEFRGKEQALDVFQVNWEQDDTLSTRIGMPQFRKPIDVQHELLLHYQQQVITVDQQYKSIELGRGDTCDLVVSGKFASRQHARIEYTFGKFVFTDHSANGSYIRFSDNQVIRLTHHEIMLHGSGSISLGQSFNDGATEIIKYLVQ